VSSSIPDEAYSSEKDETNEVEDVVIEEDDGSSDGEEERALREHRKKKEAEQQAPRHTDDSLEDCEEVPPSLHSGEQKTMVQAHKDL
jgi:hypothetical protein